MDRPDRKWLHRHSGTTTPRRMSAVLDRMGRHLEQTEGKQKSRRRDPFRSLVSCVISLRTKDEVTAEASARLLARAPDPQALSKLPEKTIARLIYPAGFYRNKAGHLRRIAKTLLRAHGGKVPDTLERLLELPGVGRKTANLVLTRGFGKPGVCVDTHVHRISNRLDFARTKTPDETEQVLRARLPKRWWIPINWILVRYGQTVCTPISPHCSDCPVRHLCPKADVDRHR